MLEDGPEAISRGNPAIDGGRMSGSDRRGEPPPDPTPTGAAVGCPG